jgi:hypothetical protein
MNDQAREQIHQEENGRRRTFESPDHPSILLRAAMFFPVYGPASERERIVNDYRWILRRAARVGWSAAEDDYRQREAVLGIADAELLERLGAIRELKAFAISAGIEPVFDQLLRDRRRIYGTGAAAVAGAVATFMLATSGESVIAALGFAVAAAIVAQEVTRDVVSLLTILAPPKN